jgi:nucleotide-binding universal stress UspA family protein
VNPNANDTPPAAASETETTQATDSPLNLQRLLVPMDFTPASLHALRYAVNMARKFDGSICLLHVVDCGLYNEVESHALLKANEEVIAAAASQLEAFATAELGEVPHTTAVRVGKPADEILQTAAFESSDLIIMALHDYKGVERVFHRHTCTAVESHAHCPVLTLHCDEAGEIEPKLWKGPAKSRIGEWVGQVFLKAFGAPNS